MQILYYIYQQKQVNASLEQHWLSQLPPRKANAVRRIQDDKKRHQSLIGLQLLKHGARKSQELPNFNLEEVQFPENEKPFWQNGLDFNISHSVDLIVCALTKKGRVGIDVEQRREITPTLLKRYSTERERSSCPNPLELWTQKEAVVKASDKGGLINIHQAEIINNTCHFENVLWTLKRIEILPDYIVQVAFEQEQENIQLVQLTVEDLAPAMQ